MTDPKEKCSLTVRTVDGKRLVFDNEGNEIKAIIKTAERQDKEQATHGICELILRVYAKCL
jgi:hypothetical protein